MDSVSITLLDVFLVGLTIRFAWWVGEVIIDEAHDVLYTWKDKWQVRQRQKEFVRTQAMNEELKKKVSRERQSK